VLGLAESGSTLQVALNDGTVLEADRVAVAAGRGRTLADLLHWDPQQAPVNTAEHCFGCTAGAGSSCGGALG
jgi:hypothetical protein